MVNPLVIKRFIQMNLRRLKTDKADAEMICKYAKGHGLWAYKPAPIYVRENRTITENIDLLIKSRTMFKNRLHAIEHKAIKHRLIIVNRLKRAIKDLNIQIQKLEQELKRLIESNRSDLFSRLQSIPGISKSTAMFMIVISDGFKKFESAKQFTCYIGLSPVEKQSGSSVKGHSRISKQGNGKLRNLLFLCSFNAFKSNEHVKLYMNVLSPSGKVKNSP